MPHEMFSITFVTSSVRIYDFTYYLSVKLILDPQRNKLPLCVCRLRCLSIVQAIRETTREISQNKIEMQQHSARV